MGEDDLRRFTVLLENIQGHVQVIAEGHGALATRMDRLEGKVDAVAEDLAIVRLDLSGVRRDVASLDVRVASLDGRVHRIEDHLGLNGAPSRAAKTAKKPATKKSPSKKR